jgi:hypothetical protein
MLSMVENSLTATKIDCFNMTNANRAVTDNLKYDIFRHWITSKKILCTLLTINKQNPKKNLYSTQLRHI